MSETRETGAPVGSTAEQLKQRMKARAREGLGEGAKLAGMKVGTVAQAVRQTGEEMRSQNQESQGRLADRLAQQAQRASGYLSQSQPDDLIASATGVREKLPQQASRLRSAVGTRVREQTEIRTGQAAEATTALGHGARTTGAQLRGQNEETQALALELAAEKIGRLGTYLTGSTPDQLRADVGRYGRTVASNAGSVGRNVAKRTETIRDKGTEAAKQVPTVARQRPAWIIAGAAAGLVLASRRVSRQQRGLGDASEATSGNAEIDVANLSRSQLEQRAQAAGIDVTPGMTKKELAAAIRASAP